MVASWIALASMSTYLLWLQVGPPGQEQKLGKRSSQERGSAAEKSSSEVPEANAVDPNAVDQGDGQELPITAKAGKYVIKVTKADAIDPMKLGMKPSSNRAASMLLEQFQNGSIQNASNNFQRNEQFFGGNRAASGGSGGAAGGFSSGSSSTSGSVTSGHEGFVRPNIAIAIEVDSKIAGIFELENMQAVDDQGNRVLWMAPGAFDFFDPVFEEDSEGAMIAYFQEENDTDFLAISGELKVTPGRRIEVEFPNGKPSKKKNGEHLFVLKDLQSNDRGIHVTMDLPQLAKKRGNPFGNAQAMMKALLEQQGAFEVWIQDSEGVLHAPGASGSAGGSSSASGSGGGGGNGGGAFGQDAQSLSTQTFTFGGLPSGREIQAVIVRATEKTGKPQSYPFKLQKVPVPYGVN